MTFSCDATPNRRQVRIQWEGGTDRTEADAALAAGHDLIVQFSRPAPDAGLAQVEALAQQAPDRVTLRFYGFHTDAPFDFALLRDLRHVRRLSLDCLHNAVNIPALGHVAGLTHLSLGVWEMTEKDILHHIDTSKLRDLRVDDMKTKAIDGSALARFAALESIWLSNSVKAHDGLRGLPHLRDVTLCARPKDSYAFLAECPELERMSFLLGGAPELVEVRSDTLTDLSVVRCRGVDDLGDLARFPRLQSLRVDDQIQLAGLDVSGAPDLTDLSLINCKTLARLEGLERTSVTDLWIHGTALDLDPLEAMDRDWTRLGLFSGRKREDDPRETRLNARGLGLSHRQGAP